MLKPKRYSSDWLRAQEPVVMASNLQSMTMKKSTRYSTIDDCLLVEQILTRRKFRKTRVRK